MKRYFSFAMLLALMLGVFSLGYAATVQIGEGTATSGNHPISGMYGYSYTQQIFTQEQIGRSGPITKIRFYHKSGSIANSKDWTIWMGHTTKTEFTSDTDWEVLTNLTQVFDGDVSALMPAEAENWMEITLDAPFNYNNTDNLLIAVHEYTPGSGTLSWGAFVSGADTGIYCRSDSDNPDPANPPEAYQRTNRINRIQLVYPDTVPPLAPILISPLNGGYTIEGEVLSWEFNLAGDDATGYDVYFGTAMDPPLVVSNQVETTYQPTLQPGTRYYWKVVANNAFGSSPASEVWTFRTPGPNNLVESFEDAQFPPLGWETTWTQSTSNPYHGSSSARRGGSTSVQHVLSTPLLTIEDDSSLSFWLRGTNSSGIIEVVHSQDGETWTQIGDDITIPMTGVYYNHNIDLSSLSGGNYYLGLRTGLVRGTYYADLFIGPTITPLPPDVPVLTGPADGAANISNFPTFTWETPGTGGVATSFNIYCDANPNPTTLIGTSTGLSYIATTGLPFDTTLYWTVKAVNDIGESALATPRSFTTMADNTIYDLSWVEDFTAEAFPPTDWGRYRGLYPTEPLETNTSRWERGDFAYIADPANPAARCRIWGTSTKHWLVTPPISIPAGTHQLEFDLALTAWGSSDPITPGEQADDRFIVLIAENPTMIGATVLREWNNTGSPYVYDDIATLSEPQAISLGGHTGVRFIGFYGESTESGGDGALFVDNVKVTELPVPAAPILVSPADGAVNLPIDGFDLTWEADLVNGAEPAYYAVFLATDPGTIYDEYAWETTNTSLNPVLEDATFSFVHSQRYYWTVAAYNADGEAVQETLYSFVIEDNPVVSTYPWIENFDALDFGEMPTHWTAIESEAGGWFAASNTTIGAHTQPMFAVVPYNATLPKNEWMITPPMSMQAGVTYNISFAVKGAGWGGVSEALALYWGTEPTVTSLTANPALFDNNGTSYADWTLENVSFTPTSTGLYFFGWHAYSQANLDYIAVDTITISQGFDVDLAIVGTSGQTIGNVGEPVVRTVAVRNMGTTAQSNYTVYLKEAATNNVLAQELIVDVLNPGETVVHILSWTPAAAGVVTLYAEVELAGDQELANNVTDPVEVTIYPANMELLFVGNPASNQGIHIFPFTVAYGDLVAETVYLASELQATDGVIHQVAYYSYFAHDMTLSHNVQIWMKNTDTVNLEAGWLPWDGYQLVYDGPVEFTTGMHEIIIPLTTPFNYTGGNLAIRTSKTYDATADPNTYNLWLLDTRGHYGYRTRVELSNDGELDHTNPTGTDVTYLYPNITFFMTTTNLVETLDAPMVTMTIAEPNALLDWELIPYAYGYNVYVSTDPYGFGEEPLGMAFGDGAQLNNITNADKLFVKVTGVTYRDFNRSQGLLRNLEPREIRLVDENLIGKAKQELRILTP